MKTKLSSIFTEKDYREALKQRQKQLKNTLGKAYSVGELAEAARIQRTYLSKVFASQADLSDDQLYLALNYLKFSEDESTYIKTLHAYQRTGLAERRRELNEKLDELRQNSLTAARHLTTEYIREPKDDSRFEKYFLDLNVQLAHMFLTVERFRNNHRDLQAALGISSARWQEILNILIELKLVAIDQNEIVVTREHIMLPKESPLMHAYHLLAKVRSANHLSEVPLNQKNSLSMIITCSKETSEQIRAQLMEFLKAMEQLVRADNKPTDVFQLSLDLFPWSH